MYISTIQIGYMVIEVSRDASGFSKVMGRQEPQLSKEGCKATIVKTVSANLEDAQMEGPRGGTLDCGFLESVRASLLLPFTVSWK